MKTTMPPINSSDNLFHDGDPSIQRDGTLLTAAHLNNVQASVIDLQSEMTNILSQTGKTPNNTSMQLAQGIIDLIDTKLTKLTLAVQFALSPTVPDASQPYHAVNLRQLQAAGGGSGASMNGVMNNFIGAVVWFNGSRAKLPAGYIPADGQKALKTDPLTADLWTAVNNNLLTSTNEATWQSDRNKRACYAYDTSATEFRVPDLNGQQSGSITGAFLRGHSASAEAQSGAVGEMRVNAAPNITGNFQPAYASSLSIIDGATGVFSMVAPYVAQTANLGSIAAGSTARNSVVSFNANSANAAYGRDSTTEVRPNSAVGIWIIRANGAFQAANTNFNVLNGDATVPPANTVVTGGSLASVYRVGGVDYVKAEMRVKAAIGSKPVAEVVLTDNSSGTPVTNTLRLGPPKSYIDGLDISVTANDVTVYSGSAMLASGEFVEVTTPITKTLPSKTVSTYYYVYLYLNGSTPEVEISTTAPTKYSGKASQKTGDATRRFLGYYRVTATGAVAESNSIDGLMRFVGPADADPMLRILANGTATTYTQIPIAGFIAAGIARSIIFDGTNSVASGAVVAYSGMNGRTYSTFQSGSNKYEAEVVFSDPNNPQLWYKYSSAPGGTGFYVDIKGFRYDR